MKVNQVNMTVSDYCAAMERDEIVVDRRYQRRPDVWPAAARSYLIETVLRGFPVPKLALHQVTDLRSRKTFKNIVDGQQRSMALLAFLEDKLRLPSNLQLREARGCIYSDLPETLQEAFMSYLLVFDQFEASSDENVREFFRRINAFTTPLSVEERRHAQYQGAMKWFINRVTNKWSSNLVGLGVVTQKRAIRMEDAKFMAELVHALLYGIETTSASKLDKMYASFEGAEAIPREDELAGILDTAFSIILTIPGIEDTSLTKSHIFYSLFLAAAAVAGEWSTLVAASEFGGQLEGQVVSSAGVERLLALASVIDDPERYENVPELVPFIAASGKGTNVKERREVRVHFLAEAMIGLRPGAADAANS